MQRIKICGLFRKQDIEYVNAAVPDFIGFVFAESRRRVSYDQAAGLRAGLDKCIFPIGVFVDAPLSDITKLYEKNIISIAQLHGNEDEEYINNLRSMCGITIIKAVKVRHSGDIAAWQKSSCDYLLLDNVSGGSGRRFDWKLVENINKPFFLAGGIDSNNIEEAMKLNPYCLDISSGAETNGVKDRDKIINLVAAVRSSVNR